MPRASDGTYSLAAGNPVTSGTTIQSSWANSTLGDISTALTDSLDRQGRGGMLAPFKFADGTSPEPSITWTNEPNSGIYRAGLGDMRVSILGSDLFRWNNAVVQVWANAQWNDIVYAGGPGGMPDGTASNQTLSWDGGQWVPTSVWVVNSAAGGGSLTGDLGITGNITLTGTVDGYDVGVLGNSYNLHQGNTSIHFDDAPADSKQYARINNSWSEVAATGAQIPSGTQDGDTTRWDTTTGEFVTDSNLRVYDDVTATVGFNWLGDDGLYFSGKDSKTVGVYNPSGADVALKGNTNFIIDDSGAEKARFDPSGRLGLGTDTPNPASLLDINGAIYTENLPLINSTTGTAAKRFEVRDALPGTPDANTIYFLTT